jgi:hypothetical protein
MVGKSAAGVAGSGLADADVVGDVPFVAVVPLDGVDDVPQPTSEHRISVVNRNRMGHLIQW